MSDNILPTILKDTFTLLQLRHRIKVLKTHLLKAFFGGGENLAQIDLSYLSSLPKTFFSQFTKDNVYEIFEEIEKLSDKLPILTIYLPFEITDNISLQIGSFSRKSFNNPSLLLDAKYDPSLIGGTALVWKGMYRDYSLRARIEGKKEELLAGFKKYLK